MINVALIGAGYAARLHCNAYSHVGMVPFTLHTICDSQLDRAKEIQTEFGFLHAEASFAAVLENPEIQVMDIVTPPFLHIDMIKRGLAAGKYVICEKPITGYFGKPEDVKPIGNMVSREKMYRSVLRDMDELRTVIEASKTKFYYAENFVYAPPVRKMAEIIARKKSKILSMRAVIAMKGSSSPLAGDWASTGGGCWARNGVHPLTAMLWLKRMEGKLHGEDIYPVSVLADMTRSTTILNEYEHRHIAAHPIDVEDQAVVTITFSDGTKGAIYAADVCIGGGRNYLDVYTNDAALETKLTDNNLLNTYLLDEDGMDGYYLAEMLPTMVGWNRAFVLDDVIRGHCGELQAFLMAVKKNEDAESNFELAYLVTKTLYGAYVSAQNGSKFDLM